MGAGTSTSTPSLRCTGTWALTACPHQLRHHVHLALVHAHAVVLHEVGVVHAPGPGAASEGVERSKRGPRVPEGDGEHARVKGAHRVHACGSNRQSCSPDPQPHTVEPIPLPAHTHMPTMPSALCPGTPYPGHPLQDVQLLLKVREQVWGALEHLDGHWDGVPVPLQLPRKHLRGKGTPKVAGVLAAGGAKERRIVNPTHVHTHTHTHTHRQT